MVKAHSRLGCSIVAIVAMVSACSAASDLVQPPTRPHATSAATRPLNSQAIADVLETARRALRRDGTGRFVREITLHGPQGRKKTVVWRSSGRYDVRLRRSRGTATVIDPSGDEGPLQLQFAIGETQRLLRASGWRCWLALTPDDPSPIDGLDLPPRHPPMPGEIAGLLRAEPTVFPSDSAEVFDVYVPLPIALGLAGVGVEVDKAFARRFAVTPIVAEIRVSSGRFASLSIDGGDVMGGMRSFFGQVADREFRTKLRRTDVEVTLRDARTAPSVALPARSDWIWLEPGTEDFDPNECGTPIV